MVYALNPSAEPATACTDISQVLTPDGVRVENGELDAHLTSLTNDDVLALYRDMVIVRRIDKEGFSLQRQGQLGLWAPCLGQEAAQIGTARALRDSDFVFPSYRETGVIYARGAEDRDYVGTWRGETNSTYDPYRINTATMQIIIGAQTLHAVGYAMGITADGADDVAVTYFGDGASSQGDVNEAMVFASSFKAPVVFVCQNNQWAISEPVRVQSEFPIAGRAPAFGIPSMRVDGNDVLACLAAMRWATEHARSGHGPAFIEAVTYRMGPHTTSDDPTRYREDAELETWRQRDPLDRVEKYLRAASALTDDVAAEIAAEADRVGAAVREAALTMPNRAPLEVFDHAYATPHTGIEAERRAYAAYLAQFEGGAS